VPPLTPAELPGGFDPADFNVFKTWTEYINRLLGALTGALILATLVLAVLEHRRAPRVWGSSLAAFVLVLFNAWLGGMVVRSGLAPLVLTGHLVGALGVVGLLLYATVSAFFPGGPARALEPERRRLGRITLGAAGLVLVQVGLGAYLRGEVQEVAQAGVPRAAWLARVGAAEVVHESFALVVAGAVALASVLAVRTRERGLGRAARVAGLLTAVQVLAGVGLGALGFPRGLQVVHLWAAALLLGALSVQALLAYRLSPGSR
jgi:cytochrome c oxidase assembly protein subunit 15